MSSKEGLSRGSSDARLDGVSPAIGPLARLEAPWIAGWRLQYFVVVTVLLHAGFLLFAREVYSDPLFLFGILLVNAIVAVDIVVRPAIVGTDPEPGWFRPAVALAVGIFFFTAYFEHRTLGWSLPAWISAIGILGLALSGSLVVYCRLTNRFTVGTLNIVEGHTLYRGGVYAYVRHPIYAALIGGTFSYGLLFRAPVTALVCATFVYLGFRARIRNEERMLIAFFGDQYVDYRRHAGAFFPRLSSAPDSIGQARR